MLVQYLKQAAYMHYGLTILDLRKLAYEFSKINKARYPKKWDDESIAGEGWTRLFRNAIPQTATQTPSKEGKKKKKNIYTSYASK